MANHSSAPVREIPHGTVNALKRRAQAVLNDRSIDAESRTIIRYALETNDPWLAELVRRAERSEAFIDSAGRLTISGTDEEKELSTENTSVS